MTALGAPPTSRTPRPTRPKPDRGAWFRMQPSGRGVVLCLVGIAFLSALFRAALASHVKGPTVFNDELIYQRLAASLGRTGHLALFTHHGLSYSPLYPLVISPIFALGVSAPTAYALIKVVNAVLVSLAVFPVYKIARFVLPRRPALLAAAVSMVLPALSYSSFVMTENLAYPLCLVSVWAMLAATRAPSARGDLLVLASIAAATAARVQLVVLVPVALTAVLLASSLGRAGDVSLRRSFARGSREHLLLFGTVAALLTVAAGVGIAGRSVSSASGSYASVFQSGLPNVGTFLKDFVEHAAALEFAVGVIPFVGTLVAASIFVRASVRRRYVPFASVAVSLTVWLLAQAAFLAAQFDGQNGELQRIHERFLIYVAPLFVISLIAACRASGRAALGVYLAAAGVAVALPLLIPWGSVINNTVGVDSFGLEWFARIHHGRLVPVGHATLFAMWLSATFSLLYVFVRRRSRSVVVVVLIVLLALVNIVSTRIESSSASARAQLPRHADWVDRATTANDVVVVTGSRTTTSGLETAFMNLSINRAYALCDPAFGADFGEQTATVDAAGGLRASGAYIRASFVVVPADLGVSGRVVARDSRGHQALVRPAGGRLSVDSTTRLGS